MDKLKFHSYEKLKKQYYEIVEIIGKERDIEVLKEIAKRNNLYLEVNGVYIDHLKQCEDKQEIDWVRVEYYKDLWYIYFFADGSIIFDVEIDDIDGGIIEDGISIEKFTEEHYENSKLDFIKAFEKQYN